MATAIQVNGASASVWYGGYGEVWGSGKVRI
jgi:hypothetical protein